MSETAQITTLANGLRVVTENFAQAASVAITVSVGAGSRDETADQHGLAHVLEHMAFKGTDTRSAQDIAEQIDAVGGDINAATGVDMTSYYVRVLAEDTPLGLDILADILLRPRFDHEELAREQHVILQEMSGLEDQPEEIVADIAQATAYPDQPLGRRIIGTEATVMAVTPATLRAYLAQHYRAGHMVVSAAGRIDHEGFAGLVARAFEGLTTGATTLAEPARYGGGPVATDSDSEQAYLVLGYDAPRLGTAESFTAQMLATILGGGTSSRLFQEARDKRGLCYSIYASYQPLVDSGLLSVHSATSADLLAELGHVISDAIADLADAGPRPDELARAYAQSRAGLLMSGESVAARAETLGRQLLTYGRVLPTDEICHRLAAVTARDIQALAAHLLTAAAPTVATLGSEVSNVAMPAFTRRPH